ncbi:rhodanese-like domain-containing protein [Halobellus sp. GM3]|uniref:rhodanese-like domain-containing protein n=1 Tax=Halobellus sp. GM3 TaxID=3458410 RepID=UPI00403E1C72
MTIEEISPEAVKRKLDAGERVQVIDIRSPPAFEAGHIPGAENVPMHELPRRVDEIEWGEDVVVACPVGQSSIQAARLIESYEGVSEGQSVKSMAGGYNAWTYDLESGAGGDTGETSGADGPEENDHSSDADA